MVRRADLCFIIRFVSFIVTELGVLPHLLLFVSVVIYTQHVHVVRSLVSRDVLSSLVRYAQRLVETHTHEFLSLSLSFSLSLSCFVSFRILSEKI